MPKKLFEKSKPVAVPERRSLESLHIAFYRADAHSAVPGQLRVVIAGEDHPVADTAFESALMAMAKKTLEAAGYEEVEGEDETEEEAPDAESPKRGGR